MATRNNSCVWIHEARIILTALDIAKDLLQKTGCSREKKKKLVNKKSWILRKVRPTFGKAFIYALFCIFLSAISLLLNSCRW